MGKLYFIEDFLHRIKDSVKIEADKDYKLVTVKMHHKGVTLREIKKGAELGSNMFRIKPGQFILSGIDARNGAFGVVPEELDGAIITNDFWCYDIDEKIVKRDFFYWLTNTPLFLDACIKSSEGTTQRIRLQNEKFKKFELRLPPLTEQDKFLKRISKIESETSALKYEFKNQEVYLKQLRQSILQEAIEGKLTADWRKTHPVVKGNPDFDAEALLVAVKTEKIKLVSEGKLKKDKQPKIPRNIISRIIPDGWEMCKGYEIFFVTKLAGFEYTDHIHLKESGDIPVIRAQNVRPIDIEKSNLLYIDMQTSLKLERSALTKPCLLVTFIGAGIGDVALFDELERWHLAPNVAKMEPFNESQINLRYLNHFLLSSSGQKEIFKHMKATAQPSLSMETIRDLDYYLPPLAEQQCIVKRVDSLLAMVDFLEKQVNERRVMADELMQSVLREAFG